MKRIAVLLLVFGNVSAFAATDTAVIGAVFTNIKFVKAIGEAEIDSIQVSEESSEQYVVDVNERAPLSDGCAYLIKVSTKKERYAAGPLTTRIRTVLDVTSIEKNCGQH